ncbi:TPR Domain containing protein [Histomonas meleagridis]|uniref:TPR Domain containing protein n=1 Tax=Histomonas meleagridis TaxID=135588 RepID=UPI0035598A31|nr:TPR Domain containing protein [Histomonas meleagridis]KAH0807133.1 TPR Domain containing protein [Histomonas meleagridis]
MATRLSSSRGRPVTSSRPMSSRKGAGYNTGLTTSGGKKVISPLEHVLDSFSQFLKDNNDSAANKIKAFKKNINGAIQESSNLLTKGDPQKALAKAKEAETEMKSFQEFINQNNTEEPDFKSIKYTVFMQLADAYKANSMFDDALHRYQRLLKDREFPNPYIIYLEIGNLHMAQKQYADAVKNYEMGINHLKNNSNRLIARFYQCCGIAQIKLGDYNKALSSFETAMRQDPSVKTGYNLVLCHSFLSSMDELKEAYTRLLAVKPRNSISDLNDSDILGNQLHVERREEVRLIILASRLVAERSDKDWQESYEFVLQQLKKSKYPEASGEFEIAYSLAHLNHRNANKAIEMLRGIRKKDPSLMALAATNLSFLYLLEQDFDKALEYANIAIDHDKYNAQALVNKGNCHWQAGREEEARDCYLEAISVEADCVEALYNFGVVSKLMGAFDEALQVLDKLNRLIPKSPEVVFQISDCYEKVGDIPNAIDWLHRLINLVQTDPAVWSRLASIWDRDGNETQAFQCYCESFKYCPSDIKVVSWLGTYYQHHQQYDNALKFFERASILAPKEPRYPLFVASCYRNMDCKQEALEMYEKVIDMDPMNRQCLEHLIKLTNEMGLTQKSDHYQAMLAEYIEREQEEMQMNNDMGDEDDLNMHLQMQRGKFVQEQFEIGGGLGMSQKNKPMKFEQEKVEAPQLRVNGNGNELVKTAVAGNGNEDLWKDVNDIDFDLGN